MHLRLPRHSPGQALSARSIPIRLWLAKITPLVAARRTPQMRYPHTSSSRRRAISCHPSLKMGPRLPMQKRRLVHSASLKLMDPAELPPLVPRALRRLQGKAAAKAAKARQPRLLLGQSHTLAQAPNSRMTRMTTCMTRATNRHRLAT